MTIYNESCLVTMDRLPDNHIDLVVTSPPYDNLRNYHGIEWNEDVWQAVIAGLYRVIKVGGTVVWVVADATVNGSETGSSFKQALYFKEVGFNIHDTMIWQKPNFTNPSFTRYHQTFEYMMIFTKGKPKTFNPINDRKNITAGATRTGRNTHRGKDGTLKERPKKIVTEFGMRHNVWYLNTSSCEAPFKSIEHPATFPEQLANDHIISWSNPGDLVYDPFLGSGTTMVVALRNGRNCIGSELSEEYCRIATSRCEEYSLVCA